LLGALLVSLGDLATNGEMVDTDEAFERYLEIWRSNTLADKALKRSLHWAPPDKAAPPNFYLAAKGDFSLGISGQAVRFALSLRFLVGVHNALGYAIQRPRGHSQTDLAEIR
jgi:hypothetical protein